jgi:endo-1,4-beta-xylanase
MVSFTSFIVTAAAFAGVLAMPTGEHSNSTALLSRAGTASSTGNDGGYYYQVYSDVVCYCGTPANVSPIQFWTNNQGDVIYTNQGSGKYEVQWSGEGDFTAGKGWSTGSARYVLSNVVIRDPGR